MGFDDYLGELRRLRPARADLGPDNLIVLQRLGSTNDLARAIVAEYAKEEQVPPPLLMLAWEQTGGRGRVGRTWSSPAGKGVYATLAFPVEDPQALSTLPLLVGVGLCRALDRWLPGRCGLKWPNDLLVAGRKLGGVLIEAQVRPGDGAVAIVGFGVNHGQEAAELAAIPAGASGSGAPRATSLRVERGEEAAGVSLAELTWALVTAVERELAHLGEAAYAVAAYGERSIHRAGEAMVCRTGEGSVEGTFLGFDERGMLRLESGGRELRLSAGELIEREALEER